MNIIIINGPNLNLTGRREKKIYGTQSFESYFKKIKTKFPDLSLNYFQSNIEGEIITTIQNSQKKYTGIILNAGGYSHTSVAIHDVIKAVKIPVVEVHISNIFAREEFRQKSLLTPVCAGIISGFGLQSYELALNWFRMR